jgi:hypothetical protein
LIDPRATAAERLDEGLAEEADLEPAPVAKIERKGVESRGLEEEFLDNEPAEELIAAPVSASRGIRGNEDSYNEFRLESSLTEFLDRSVNGVERAATELTGEEDLTTEEDEAVELDDTTDEEEAKVGGLGGGGDRAGAAALCCMLMIGPSTP